MPAPAKAKSKPLDPASFAKNGSEHGNQVALFVWASQNTTDHPELRLMYAIPNGGERNKIVAANLKAEGVRSGVPDIFLPAARGNWHGLYIELKRPKSEGKTAGRVSDDQKQWSDALQAQGYGVAVAVGWEQARDVLLQYLNWVSK